MKKEVLVTITGSQTDGETTENTEVKTVGEYYRKNDRHFVLFEELSEDRKVSKNTIKITDHDISLIRSGEQSTRLVFEKGRKNLSYYTTPFGELMLGVDTEEIEVEESDSRIKARIVYGLEMNGALATTNTIQIEVREIGN